MRYILLALAFGVLFPVPKNQELVNSGLSPDIEIRADGVVRTPLVVDLQEFGFKAKLAGWAITGCDSQCLAFYAPGYDASVKY